MMKFVQISVHFEYTDFIDNLLDKHRVIDYVRYPMMEGKDQEGKHFGSQVFPGNFTVYQAQVREDMIADLFEAMETFRCSKAAHHHLQAVVLPIERCLRLPDTGQPE
ncbi:PG0541 family transporter-associated protein [Gilvimarinus sp. F26214L]|uniref:PG0541 family transporter-associated protein n=1 Tax=Gilvimarinus sp. DZF01 TaxID=3461371 RepID=UPI0040457D71